MPPKRAKNAKQPSNTGTLGEIIYAKTQSPMSEKDWVCLVRAMAAGDQLALHSIYEQTYRIVFTLMVRMTSNRETAEELTLDVFHDVWRRASGHDPTNGSVVGWIMNQARSRAIDRLRFEQRKKRINTGTVDPLAATPDVDPQDAFFSKNRVAC